MKTASMEASIHEKTKIFDVKSEIKLPSKFVKSAVRSEKLKFQSCPNDLSESLEDPTPPSGPSCNPPVPATSVGNVESNAEASIPIPDISEGLKGKWLLDATDAGLTAISETDDMVLH